MGNAEENSVNYEPIYNGIHPNDKLYTVTVAELPDDYPICFYQNRGFREDNLYSIQ